MVAGGGRWGVGVNRGPRDQRVNRDLCVPQGEKRIQAGRDPVKARALQTRTDGLGTLWCVLSIFFTPGIEQSVLPGGRCPLLPPQPKEVEEFSLLLLRAIFGAQRRRDFLS